MIPTPYPLAVDQRERMPHVIGLDVARRHFKARARTVGTVDIVAGLPIVSVSTMIVRTSSRSIRQQIAEGETIFSEHDVTAPHADRCAEYRAGRNERVKFSAFAARVNGCW